MLHQGRLTHGKRATRCAECVRGITKNVRTAKSHDYVTHPNMLFDHQSLREAGASEGATLTLNLEAAPVKLRTIRATCYFSPLYTKKKQRWETSFGNWFPSDCLGRIKPLRFYSALHVLQRPLFTKKTNQLRFYSVVRLLHRSLICKKKNDCHSIMFCYFYSDPLLLDADGQAWPGLVVVPP